MYLLWIEYVINCFFFCFFIQDASLLCFTRKQLAEMKIGNIKCDSLEDARNRINGISKMPNLNFINCLFPCKVNGTICIAVEKYNRSFSYSTQGQRQKAIWYVILFFFFFVKKKLLFGHNKSNKVFFTAISSKMLLT